MIKEDIPRMCYLHSLNPRERPLYYGICKALIRYDDEISISPFVEQSVFSRAWLAVQRDHPEYFHVNWWSYTYNERLGLISKVHPRYLCTRTSYEIYTQRLAEYDERVSAALKNAKSCEKFAMCKTIASYITKNVRYLNKDDRFDHTLANPAVNGTGVCEGISALYLHLCQINGIGCMMISGNNHAWNVVSSSGGWLHLDLTSLLGRQKITDKCFLTNAMAKQSGYVFPPTIIPED